MAIYFAQAGEGGPIKIGYSAKPARRLSKMKTDCPAPLRVLGILDGERSLEAEFHAQFSEFNLHGEWFQPAPKLLALTEGMPTISLRCGRKPRARINMTNMLSNASEIIDALGGTGETASLFGVLPSAVSNWRRTGFPPRLHYRVSKEAEQRGLEIDPAVYVSIAEIEQTTGYVKTE